jgi:hypothetical protein
MRRLPIFIIFLFVFFFVFACDLQFPKEIEIKKQTPELIFEADVDDVELSKVFGDLDFDFGTASNIKIINCVNTEILSLIIYIDLFEGDIGDILRDELDYALNFPDDYKISTNIIPTLVQSSAPINIKIPDFSGTPLEGFTINPLQTRMYLSGSNDKFLNLLVADVTGSDHSFGRSQPSGLSDINEYNGLSLPSSNNTFNVSFEEDFDVEFEVYFMKDREIEAGWLKEELYIFVELAVWFPFKFIAGPDVKDMKLPFDDLFSSSNDLFGRNSADADSLVDYIDNLSLEIVLNRNPFPDSALIVTSGSQQLNSVIKGNALNILIEKDDINFPFFPSFSIGFKEGDTVIVPRVLIVENFAFKAKLTHSIDLSDFAEKWPW